VKLHPAKKTGAPDWFIGAFDKGSAIFFTLGNQQARPPQRSLQRACLACGTTRETLVQRLLCSRAKVNLQKLRNGFLSDRDFPSLTAAAEKLAQSSLLIDDTAGLSISELRAKARRLKAQHDIQLIVIDYLQLLKGSSRRSQDNRQLEISEISAGIKALAKELNIPIIVIAQLNRQPELRGNGKPRL